MDESVLQKAIAHYGTDHQFSMVQEEASELIQAISKFIHRNKRDAREMVIEEAADVKVMLRQLEIMLDAKDEINAVVDKKITRLNQRVNLAKVQAAA